MPIIKIFGAAHDQMLSFVSLLSFSAVLLIPSTCHRALHLNSERANNNESLSSPRVLCFSSSIHLTSCYEPIVIFLLYDTVIASPIYVPYTTIRTRQSYQPIYNTNVDQTANSGWTGRNEFIATSYIVSGQSGSKKQLIQETQPELDASFFSSTPYEATIVPGIISSSLEEPETSD